MTADAPARRLELPDPLGPASGYRDRLVAVDSWAHRDLYWGRDKVRRTVLAMTSPPADGTTGELLVPPLRDGARFWAMVAADGRPLALSTGSFLTLAALRADASAVVAQLTRLTAHRVHDPATGLSAAWFALDTRVVAVSGIAWREEHDLGALLKALHRCTRWGPAEPGDPVTPHRRRG